MHRRYLLDWITKTKRRLLKIKIEWMQKEEILVSNKSKVQILTLSVMLNNPQLSHQVWAAMISHWTRKNKQRLDQQVQMEEDLQKIRNQEDLLKDQIELSLSKTIRNKIQPLEVLD